MLIVTGGRFSMRPTWEQEKKRLGPRCSMHAADRAERAHPLKEPGKRAARQSRGAMPERPRSARRLYRSFNGIEAVADWQRSGAVENSPPESQALAGNITEPQRANNKWGRDNDYRCCDRDHLALGSPLRDERDLRQPVSKVRFIGPDCRILHGREAMPRPARADRGCTGGTSGEVFVLRACNLPEQRIHSPRAT